MATADRTNSVCECPICCERYKTPKMISCGHSFCLAPCLLNLMQSDSPRCPLCRTQLQLPPSNKVEDLPTNFALQSVVEVSTPNDEARPVFQVSNESYPVKQSCVKHDEDFVVYCEECSELLCQKCLNEIHDQHHNTIDVQRAVDNYCRMLVPVEQDLIALNKKSDDIVSSLTVAKQKCKAEADSVRTKIEEAAEAVIQLVRERTRELHLEVDKKEEIIVKRLEDLEAKGAELSLFSDCTRSMCEKLKIELKQLQFKRKNATDSISKKATTLFKDMSALEKQAVQDPESICFRPNQPLKCIPLGILTDSPEGTECKLSLMKLTDMSYSMSHAIPYIGFTLLTTNCVVFLWYFKNTLYFSHRTGQSPEISSQISVDGKVTNMSSIGHGNLTRFLIVCNNQTLHKVTSNVSNMSVREDNIITLRAALLYRISAVSWCELGEKCYALLNDGVTIELFSFSPNKETLHVRLEEKVKCSTSRGFHVSEFGMAICDEEKRQVRFYETSKSTSITRAITEPPGMEGGCPVCVVSLKKNKKWCVLWTKSYPGKFSSIYQYSVSFDKECVLLEVPCHILDSFCFLDEKYMATGTREGKYLSVSVYCIEQGITDPKK